MRDTVHTRAPVAGGVTEVAEDLAGGPVHVRAGLWRKLGAALDEGVELAGDGGEGRDGGGWIGHGGHSGWLLVSRRPLRELFASHTRRGDQRRKCTMAGAARQWDDNSDVQGGGHGYAVSISGSALYAWNGDGIMHATW